VKPLSAVRAISPKPTATCIAQPRAKLGVLGFSDAVLIRPPLWQQQTAKVIHVVVAAAQCRYASACQCVVEMRIEAGALGRLPSTAAVDPEVVVAELREGDVLEGQRQVNAAPTSAIVVAIAIAFLTRPPLRVARVCEPLDLALLDGVIVGILRLARYLAV